MSNLPQAGPLATLGIAAGPRYGEQIPVPAPVVTIGRGSACEVQVDDDSVSDRHARLEFDLGAWRITDLNSTNGTAIEGVTLAPEVPTPLPYGASLRVGGVRLQFREGDSAAVEAARASYVAPARPTTLKEERSGPRFPLWLAVLVVILIALVAYAVVRMNQPPPPLQHPTDAPAAQAPQAQPAAAPVILPPQQLLGDSAAAAPAQGDSAAPDSAAPTADSTPARATP